MMLFCALAAISSPVLWPGPVDLMETSAIYSWTVPQLLGMQSRILEDGVPLLIDGFEPLPGWGSFESMIIRSPIEAGLWAGGGWELDFRSSEIPDSSYSSGAGLLENTSSRNRYSMYLRRPLPAGFMVDFTMSREDTLKNQKLRFCRGNLEAGGRGWQTSGNGYALWTSWKPEGFLGRFSFARLYQGSRQWELLGSLSAGIGAMGIDAGAAGSLSGDELSDIEGHLRVAFPVSGINLILRGDLAGPPDGLSPGGSAGISAGWSFLNFQIGAVKPPDSAVFMLGVLSGGPASIVVSIDSGGVESGLQTILTADHGFLMAGSSIESDTIKFSGTVMHNLRWGANGLIHGGVSWELTDTPDDLTGTLDLKSMFTLGRFAFIFAVEDILDDYHSYTFGITWTFNDHPPRRIEEEEERGS